MFIEIWALKIPKSYEIWPKSLEIWPMITHKMLASAASKHYLRDLGHIARDFGTVIEGFRLTRWTRMRAHKSHKMA